MAHSTEHGTVPKFVSSKPSIDFGKLVNTLMANPFATNTGLNTQDKYLGKASQRQGANTLSRTKHYKPGRENNSRFRKTVNVGRYR